jgi:tetratricopeptide (TPR) repeat protein
MVERDNVTYLLALTDAQVKNKKYDIALDRLLKILNTEPNNSRVVFSVCNVYSKKRFYTAAIKFCERTIDLNPQNITVMNRLAWLYAKKGIKIERGIELIQTVMQTNPNKAIYIDTFAELLFAKGDIVGAVKNINKAISIDPDNSYYKQQELRFKNTSTQLLDVDDF